MTPTTAARAAWLLLLGGPLVGALAAQGPSPLPAPASRGWRPQLQLDNDAYNFWLHPAHRPDEQYTNGVRVSLESWSAPWWGRHFAARRPDCAVATPHDACRLTTLTLGQDIYTPRLDRTPFTVANWEQERPYFGWLYLQGRAELASPRLLRTTAVVMGVTGPPSLGHAMQALFHLINRRYTKEANGWETQIGFEPGLIVTERLDWRAVTLGGARGLGFDIVPALGLSAGNILSEAELGGSARLGVHLSHPWHPPAWQERPRGEFFLRGGGRLRHVWYDMSLDGNTVGKDRFVDRVPAVQEYHLGLGARWRRVRLEYRAVTVSREYRTGPGHHTWSTLFTGWEGIR